MITSAHDTSTARVCISDGGVGVQSRDVARAFEPFVEIDPQAGLTSRHGIGLGLSTSRALARALSGDVTLQSGTGEGSTFTLSLPLAR